MRDLGKFVHPTKKEKKQLFAKIAMCFFLKPISTCNFLPFPRRFLGTVSLPKPEINDWPSVSNLGILGGMKSDQPNYKVINTTGT